FCVRGGLIVRRFFSTALLLLLVLLVALSVSIASDSSAPAHPNIVLISIDTLRADALGCYGNKQIQTPNIDELSKSSLIFRNLISSVPLTLPSHASLLTGMLPVHHGIHDNHAARLDPNQMTLALALKQTGYTTQAFVSSLILDHHFGLDRGFDR